LGPKKLLGRVERPLLPPLGELRVPLWARAMWVWPLGLIKKLGRGERPLLPNKTQRSLPRPLLLREWSRTLRIIIPTTPL